MRLRPRLLPSGRVAMLIDLALVAWMISVAQYYVSHWPDPLNLWREMDPLGRGLLVAVHLPLVARRRYPMTVFLLVATAAATYLTLGYYHAMTTFALALALYSLAAYTTTRASLMGAAAAFVILLWGNRLAEPNLRIVGATMATAIAAIGWAFGEATRRLSERGESLKVLTERLKREQEERARSAVTREQGRIARELHDVVAHHMSVVSVQAGLGRYVFDSDPATARHTLKVIADSSHEALGEMRRMLAVLRVSADDCCTDEAPFDAAAGLAQLAELLDRVRAAGATVDLTETGSAPPLNPGLDLCVYRVIQESLTNVLKHADPPHATVAIGWSDHEVAVRVTNAGAATPAGDGHGLIGMRERARIYGGTLVAGPKQGGGFEVALRLPTREVDS